MDRNVFREVYFWLLLRLCEDEDVYTGGTVGESG